MKNEITPIQIDAWNCCNAALNSEIPTVRAWYMDMGKTLYRQDMVERIQVLFDRSDIQNRILDDIEIFNNKRIPILVGNKFYEGDSGDEINT